MKKAPSVSHPRPFMVGRKVPQSRTEAAVELVRLEYEAARLSRDLDQLERRHARSARALSQVEARTSVLHRRLTPGESS